MSTFMQAQLTERQLWYVVDGDGTDYIPADVVGDLPHVLADGGEVSEDSLTDSLAESYPTSCQIRAARIWSQIVASLRDYVECSAARIQSVSLQSGFGVRSSAPGYMDRTEWSVYDTEQEAIAAYYAECQENDENDPEAAAFDTLQIPATNAKLRAAWRWHAENSTTIVGERAAQALRLARAELWLLDLEAAGRATITIDADDDPIVYNGDGAHTQWIVTVKILDADGDTVSEESLGSVDVGDTGGITPDFRSPSWGLLRTVRAELAAELFAEYAPMTSIG